MTLRAAPYGDEVSRTLTRLIAWLAEREATAWITLPRIEFAANVAMFIPLGIFVVLWFGVRGWWLAPIIGFGLSAAIEIAQWMFLDTRVADPRDLLSNTIGAVIGMLIMLLLAFLLSPPKRKS